MLYYSSFPAVATFASLSFAFHHEVTVGKNGDLRFDPENVVARPGDKITYHFFAKNHAVAQSSFDHPCQYLENGIFSGFTPTESQSEAAPTTFTITLNDTKPLWFYCPQTTGNHCQKGMVHSVNAPSEGNTLDAYRSKAKDARTSTAREDGLPVGGTRILHIDVGLDGKLEFSPSDSQALPGTVVQFSFNPKNHTVTQSSFDKPCQQLENGFSSGFIPTTVSPSGALFHLVVEDKKPLWFYCAQTNGDHCQKGMVGSINAPSEGNTFTAFKDLAKKAKTPSTIDSHAPIGGFLSVNGTIIPEIGGNVLVVEPWHDKYLEETPKRGHIDPYMGGMAGGGPIEDYGWAEKISDSATEYLQLLNWLDNILIHHLFSGYQKLTTGDWKRQYPETITQAVGSMAAQSYMLRTAATDSLQRYEKPVAEVCKYKTATSTFDEFIDKAVVVTLLEISLLIDIVTKVAKTDEWLVPCVASSLGAKSRMSGVLNMMQNHMASASPREPALPAKLVYSYAKSQFIDSCSGKVEGWPSDSLPELKLKEKVVHIETRRVLSVQVEFEDKGDKGRRWIAFLGAWGAIRFSLLSEDKRAEVPKGLSGHVWMVVTNKKDIEMSELYEASVAGPALLWASQP